MKKLGKLLLSLMLVASVAGCSSSTPSQTTSSDALFTAGTYTGTARGNNGDVTVEVTFTDSTIESVTVTEHAETEGIADPALEQIPSEIVEGQTLAVDTVAGATNTSNAIIDAVTDCVEQADGDVEALSVAKEEAPVEKTEEEVSTDVLVVGGGIAGLTSAMKAAELGANVTLIEKMPNIGGTTALAGGYLVCADSESYTTENDDSVAHMLEYWQTRMAYSGAESGYPDWGRLENVLTDTGKSVDYLREAGVQFNDELFYGFGDYPVANHVSGGAGLVADLGKICEDRGVTIVTNMKATELVSDDTGTVVGVKAEGETSNVTYSAKAVILATGGISGNPEMVEQYSPELVNVIPTSAAGSTGDGVVMAQAVGADVFDDFFTAIWATQIDPEFLAVNPDAATLTTVNQLGVDGNGERFASENPIYVDALGSDMIQHNTYPYWYIYDSANADVTAILETGVESGVVVKADSIEALAEGMGVPSDALVRNYEAYMQAVAAGEDEAYGKDASMLVALETAPYYAVKFYPTTFGSTGGVETDTEGRVLNTEGTVIPGLYAAGEMSNRYYYNENYILAASLGLYATNGLRAGEAAVVDSGLAE